jgi:16S rRNA (cytosine1402-N4)-methyltransferase
VNGEVPRAFEHVPVMLGRAVELLNVRPGLTYIDATAGGGGHLFAIHKLLRGTGRLIAFDQDLSCIEVLKERFQAPAVTAIHANFSRLSRELEKIGLNTVDGGILADLGVSSMQFDDSTRGFSLNRDGPLDMRMDAGQKLTAHELVNQLNEERLADIIYRFGEERQSRAIARAIVRARPVESTRQLADVVAGAVKRGLGRRAKLVRRNAALSSSVTVHPATRTFQALRIAVNGELDNLKIFLDQSAEILAPGARLVVITFHSLEDRLVKEFFRREASNCICPGRQPVCTCDKKARFSIITRKPLTPDAQEVLANVRSRSAKLRGGEKLS